MAQLGLGASLTTTAPLSLTVQPHEPTGMILDLVRGDLSAGFALLDWLGERHDPHRRLQADLLRCAIGDLVQSARCAASPPGSQRDTQRDPFPVLHADYGHRRAWPLFVASILSTFTLDLYSPDDLIRFVGQVLQPGQVDEGQS